jgi:uncharacterized membrane protein (UPF0136 family)
MTWNVVVWIYTALLLVGGLIGFLKAGSRASLIASGTSAIPLVLTAAGILPFLAAPVVLAALVVVFGIRLANTGKFMPSGMLLAVTVLALAVVWALRPR